MDHYIGVKIIEAEPCPAWKDMGEHKAGDPGYKVRYPDGYVSWSPKDVFEEAYFRMGEDPSKITEDMVKRFIGPVYTDQMDDKTTVVGAETVTGFRQYEVSSCVDPANYDPKIGKEIGLKRIEDTIWKCLGFVLQWGRFGIRQGGYWTKRDI